MDLDRAAAAKNLHDVVVVGARVAGAPTAMLLARQGLDVVIVDRAELPSDTLSTHAISRGGVVQLSRWGLLGEVLASGAPPIRSLSFHTHGRSVVKEVKDLAGVDHLLAPRRHVLDAILLRAAEEAGATVQTEVSVTNTLTDRRGRTIGVTVRDRDGVTRELHARFVIGADGVRSRVARSVGARTVEDRGPTGAMAYLYVAGLDAEGFEFHLGDRTLDGVYPTHGGEANVWLCRPEPEALLGLGGPAASFLDLLGESSPELVARLGSARITSPVRVATELPNHIREAAGPGWALVGDAGYHRDPITGHGITDAFRDAELLARQLGAVLRDDAPEREAMAAYAAGRDRALRPVFDVTFAMAKIPPLERLIELQKRLSDLMGAEATELAALPDLTRHLQAVA